MPRFELHTTKFRIHPPRGSQDAAPEFVLMDKLMKTLGAELKEYRANDGYYEIAVPSLQIEGFRRWVKKERWYGRELDGTGNWVFMK